MFVEQIDMDQVMKVRRSFSWSAHLLLWLQEPILSGFAFQAKSIREFDKLFTAVMFGYRTLDDYYSDASPNRRLKSVGIPVLCLNAADDVFSPSHGECRPATHFGIK